MSGKAVNRNSLISGSSLLEQKSNFPVNPSALSHSPLAGLLSALREKLNFAGYHGRDLELGPCLWEEEEGGEGGVHPPGLLTKKAELLPMLAKPKFLLTQLLCSNVGK